MSTGFTKIKLGFVVNEDDITSELRREYLTLIQEAIANHQVNNSRDKELLDSLIKGFDAEFWENS